MLGILHSPKRLSGDDSAIIQGPDCRRHNQHTFGQIFSIMTRQMTLHLRSTRRKGDKPNLCKSLG